jgi:hypothetical protein
MSATASQIAFDILKNTSINDEDKLKWYVVFQSISNASLLSWYYHAADIEKKNNNMYNVLGLMLDVGLTIATNPPSYGLTTGAIKSVFNEVTLTSLWAYNHGLPTLNIDAADDMDVSLSFYATRNNIYASYVNGNVTNIYSQKRKLAVPSNKMVRYGNKRLFTMKIPSRDFDRIGVVC